ncbi:predicted protein [Chaetomium globosum CBS 148.51]|uniref:Uncharacterized protein n=1 Tax=Chaetomium globosum (strain ATCC 6205 / CBS 148.51 / DSM 1962 / NBRC 6347 / NRRL 1970) TaxID=306901 RepID=Q2H644_CHAGB|nr:uncharacterized protein CHGG_05871 [Chaetomium globosum CBS 148.51]EAQ89252.1 predicted protein [Chaetomium globosum CBS 148.51]
MHAQYRSNRDTLLRACLTRELDGCFVDAYACLKSRVRVMRPVRTDEKITDFLTGYRTWIEGPSPPPNLSFLDPSSCRWVAAFQVSVIGPLCRRYAEWALANLARTRGTSLDSHGAAKKGAESEAAPAPQPTLSRSEEIRIFRALYRYETFCHLFGRNRCDRYGGFREEQINESVLMPVRSMGKPKLSTVSVSSCATKGGISRYSDTDDGRLHGWYHLSRPRGASQAFGSQGPRNSRRQSWGCITGHHNVDAPLRKVFWNVTQNGRRDDSTAVNARDDAQQRRDPMEFGGDILPPDGPPLAWVLLWGGIYANLYGEYTPSWLKDWGYVMWDERRLVELGVTDLVSRQWETEPEAISLIEEYYAWRPAGY